MQVEPCAHCEQLDRSFRQIDRTSFQLLGMAPDIDEPLLPHVATGQGKLHARIKLAVGRNVTGGVTRAARQGVHAAGFRRGRRRTEPIGIADESFVAKKPAQCRLACIQIEDPAIAIHHRRDRRIQSTLGAKFIRQPPDAVIVLQFSVISTLAMMTFRPCDLRKRIALIDRRSEPGTLVIASCTSGRCE
ncbi:MAG: hypothetical protein WBP77_09900 [Candidatus Sulfotelmatobacter sp.]